MRLLLFPRSSLLLALLLPASAVACSDRRVDPPSTTATATLSPSTGAASSAIASMGGDASSSPLGDAAAPPSTFAFDRIEDGFFDRDNVVVLIDANSIYRFDEAVRVPATLERKGYMVVHRNDNKQELELVSDREVKVFDLSLQLKSTCAIPAGFATIMQSPPFFLLKNASGAFATLHTRTCKRTDLPGFAKELAKELEGSSMGAEATLISPSGTRVGIVRGFCASVDVYDAASMKKVGTDRGSKAPAAASAKGCDAVSITDEGKVAWLPRGMCAIGELMTFIAPNVALVGESDRIVIKRGVKPTTCSGMGLDQDLPVKPTIIGSIEKADLRIPDPRIFDATTRRVLVANNTDAVVIKLAAKSETRQLTATESRKLSRETLLTVPVRPKPKP